MSSRLRLAIAFGLLVAIGLGAIYWYRTHEIAVEIARPQSNVEVRVFGIGTVEAQVVSRVGFQVAGKVNALAADQGDIVKAGTVLARLDADAQRAKLMKSDAALRQSAANLLRVQAQRDRADVSYQQKKSVHARRQSLGGRRAAPQRIDLRQRVGQRFAGNGDAIYLLFKLMTPEHITAFSRQSDN